MACYRDSFTFLLLEEDWIFFTIVHHLISSMLYMLLAG
jgi:hypothetical protein